MVPVLESNNGKCQEKQERVSATVNYTAILPDSDWILSTQRPDGGHISWHLLVASLSSLSTVLSKWHHSFRNSEMRTLKCYVNGRDCCFFMILTSEILPHLLCFGSSSWGEGGEWNGIGCSTIGNLWIDLVWLVIYLRVIVGMLYLSLDNTRQQQSVSVVSLWGRLINPNHWTATFYFCLKSYLGKYFRNKSVRFVWFLIICPVVS